MFQLERYTTGSERRETKLVKYLIVSPGCAYGRSSPFTGKLHKDHSFEKNHPLYCGINYTDKVTYL